MTNKLRSDIMSTMKKKIRPIILLLQFIAILFIVSFHHHNDADSHHDCSICIVVDMLHVATLPDAALHVIQLALLWIIAVSSILIIEQRKYSFSGLSPPIL
ncbi:MAG: hypothetical protein PHD29_03685 [bacterium]|nr:hypothetical protein [bacterium]MDD5756749.1 hypothetical protein [bacterium]